MLTSYEEKGREDINGKGTTKKGGLKLFSLSLFMSVK